MSRVDCLPVLKMGTSSLWERSIEVQNIDAKDLQPLVDSMAISRHVYQGVGIAASQIGINKRVIVFGIESVNSRYPHRPLVPLTVLVNPVFEPLSDEMEEEWEGCLSIPGLRGLVPRYRDIKYAGYALDGSRIEREATGFHARIIQHECDHLDGRLYPSRIKDFTKFAFEDTLKSL